MVTRLLVDGDLIAYRCAASAENENEHIAAARMESLLDNCLINTESDEFEIFISGPTNFRYQVYPEYKATRTQPKPKYLAYCKDYLLDKYNATISDNCEADDCMAIAQSAENAGTRTIICSLDKDLLQVPGWHYSWEIQGGPVTKRWVKEALLHEISPIEGLRRFYKQMLTGDTSDNVKGVHGIGKVNAERMINHLETEEEMFDAVRGCYSSDEEMLMNGRCLWMQRQVGQIWRFPFEDKI